MHWLLRRRRTRLKQLAAGLALTFVLYQYGLFSRGHGSSRIRDDVMDVRLKRYYDYQRTQGDRRGPGENDADVSLTEEEQKRASELHEKEGMNIVASDKVALDRALLDSRSLACRTKVYPNELPTASVVIIYHNEAWSPILRTVHSVVNRSPPQYLHEVILLDDASTRPELAEPLHTYVQDTWPDGVVKIVRSDTRLGLINAKLTGAKAASGDVLVFLDAHCEASNGWLEPLLARIKEKRTAVLCPSIDGISAESLQYQAGGGTAVGGFSWGLHFTWRYQNAKESSFRRSETDPLRSPTMPGGLFAADRKYFFEIGGYDPGMEIWGGENLELSFRVWMCGGSVEFIPCSKVGHIFRSTHPYGFPDKKRDYHGLNSLRMARVWMDDYIRLFYNHRNKLQDADCGDISERLALRERLQCHSFKWYLDNVYADKFVPDEDVIAWGQLRNPGTDVCIDTLAANEHGSFQLGLFPCQKGTNQLFSLSVKHELRREFHCAEIKHSKGSEVHMEMCHEKGNIHRWTYNTNTKELRHYKLELCLDKGGQLDAKYATANKCSGAASQQWDWENWVGEANPIHGEV